MYMGLPTQQPRHNLFGQLGPRCHWCSGLGKVLKMPGGPAPTKNSSPCTCRGTGIDMETMFQSQISELTKKIQKLERQQLRDAKKRAELYELLRAKSPKNSRQYWSELIA